MHSLLSLLLYHHPIDIFDDPLDGNNYNISNNNNIHQHHLPNPSITPSIDDTASNENTPDIRDMPPIRDNPDMAATTARRRSSVAHPHSIKYSDPGISVDEDDSTSSDETGDDDNDSQDANILSAENENGDVSDPSISDLNDIVNIFICIPNITLLIIINNYYRE